MPTDVTDATAVALTVAIGVALVGRAGSIVQKRPTARRAVLDVIAPLRRIGSRWVGALGIVAVAVVGSVGVSIAVAPRSTPSAVLLLVVAAVTLAWTMAASRATRSPFWDRNAVAQVSFAGVAVAVAVYSLLDADVGPVPVAVHGLGAVVGIGVTIWPIRREIVDGITRAVHVLGRRPRFGPPTPRPTPRPTLRAIRAVVERDVEPQATRWADLAWWAATVTSSDGGIGSTTLTLTVPGRRGQLRAVAGHDRSVTLVLVCPGAAVSGVSARLPLASERSGVET